MKKSKEEIQNEWTLYLRRSRLSYVTSSLLKFYDILEEMVPVKGDSFLGYDGRTCYTRYELHFTHCTKLNITYRIVFNERDKEVLVKKQKQQVCKFYLNDRNGYFFRKKQPMESIRPIMEELVAITKDLTIELNRKDEIHVPR